MEAHSSPANGLLVTSEDGLSYVAVPWGQAGELYARVKRLGSGYTLYLDPSAREARLELWPGVDSAPVLQVLAGPSGLPVS